MDAVGVVQKGQLTQCTQQIRIMGTITFSAKRSFYPIAVDAVGTLDAVDTVSMGGSDI